MLLAFQKAITLHQQNLYETRAVHKLKRGAANNKFGSTAFDKLWNLDSILLTSKLNFLLLSTLIAFQNVKALLIWSKYDILVVLQSLAIILEIDSRFWRYVLNLYGFVYMKYSRMNIFALF